MSQHPVQMASVPLVVLKQSMNVITLALRQGAFNQLPIHELHTVTGTLIDINMSVQYAEKQAAEEEEHQKRRAIVEAALNSVKETPAVREVKQVFDFRPHPTEAKAE